MWDVLHLLSVCAFSAIIDGQKKAFFSFSLRHANGSSSSSAWLAEENLTQILFYSEEKMGGGETDCYVHDGIDAAASKVDFLQ